MLLSLTQGHESFRQETSKINVFYRRKGEAEQPILKSVRPDNYRMERRDKGEDYVISNVQHMAGIGNRNFGYWQDSTVNVSERSLIRIMFQKKTGSLILYDRMQILIHMREKAALRRITLELTNNVNSTRSEAHFEGRFDIVGEHLFPLLDIDVPKNVRFQFNPETWEDNIRINVLEDEVSRFVIRRKKLLVKADGGQVYINQSRKRLIRMKKPKKGNTR